MGGSTQDAQRKAWNDAMRSAAGHPGQSSARRSDRQKKQARREKARKSTLDVTGGDNSLEGREYRAAVRIDSLEEVLADSNAAEEEEEYDELDEAEGVGGGGSKRKRRGGGGNVAKVGTIPKRLRPRSLGALLIEEASRGDKGVTRNYLDAEARPAGRGGGVYPRRKFCPVTGLFGVYTDPKSGIPYANMKALEQIRERAPPWMTLGGSAAYFEAIKSLRDDA